MSGPEATMQTEQALVGATISDVEWYSKSPAAVADALGVTPAAGLSAATAAARLRADGPNALTEEKPRPGWLRFLEQYRSYMQIILVAAAVVSLVIAEWGTAVLLLVLTVLNAVIGLRQEGKAESAMNALKSMMKPTARVRRDGEGARSPPRNWSWATSSGSFGRRARPSYGRPMPVTGDRPWPGRPHRVRSSPRPPSRLRAAHRDRGQLTRPVVRSPAPTPRGRRLLVDPLVLA
jgi:hypothetical protein